MCVWTCITNPSGYRKSPKCPHKDSETREILPREKKRLGLGGRVRFEIRTKGFLNGNTFLDSTRIVKYMLCMHACTVFDFGSVFPVSISVVNEFV